LGARDKRLETLGSSPCNKTGASTPATAELRAAIFETGATSGEASAVALLLDNRRLVLDQCEALLDRLADANAATVAPEVLTAELRARVAATLEKHPPPFPPTVDLLAFAEAQLKATSGTRGDRIAKVAAELRQLREHVLNAKPPLH
jgi:hypothetical protein